MDSAEEKKDEHAETLSQAGDSAEDKKDKHAEALSQPGDSAEDKKGKHAEALSQARGGAEEQKDAHAEASGQPGDSTEDKKDTAPSQRVIIQLKIRDFERQFSKKKMMAFQESLAAQGYFTKDSREVEKLRKRKTQPETLGETDSFELQKKRRELRTKWLGFELGDDHAKRMVLSHELCENLTGLAPARTLLSKYILAPFSEKILQEMEDNRSGSQPTGFAPNYTKLLVAGRFITLPPNHRGRKAGSLTQEIPLSEEEKSDNYTKFGLWIEWWMKMGGWRAIDQVDDNGWTPLHHALDSMTFSERAGHVARALINDGPNVVHVATTGSQPNKYTPLHFACDGSDLVFGSAGVVAMLLDAESDIEARGGKENTPLLIAAGAGLTDVCKVLVQRGADICATNYQKKSCWQKARGSSPSLADYLASVNALQTEASGSGRTRTGIGQAREARYAATTSWSSNYSYGGGWGWRGSGRWQW